MSAQPGHRPISAAECRLIDYPKDHFACDLERYESSPFMCPRDERFGPVDSIEKPSPLAIARLALLFAQNRIVWSFSSEQLTKCALDGFVSVGYKPTIGLRPLAQRSTEPSERDAARLVGELMTKNTILFKPLDQDISPDSQQSV